MSTTKRTKSEAETDPAQSDDATKPAAGADKAEPDSTQAPAAADEAADPGRPNDAPDPQAEADAAAGVTHIHAEVQSKVDAETRQGFRGVEVDPTPNEAYTVSGVVSGAPTPETHPEAADAAASATRGMIRAGDGQGPR